jgi:hypothetical protein
MAYEIKGRLSVGQLFSLPRLTTVERVALGATLAAVDNGSQVWDTDLNVVFTWNGAWEFTSTVDWATITADPAPAVLGAKYVLDYAAAGNLTLPATSGSGKEVNVLLISENVTVGVQAGETLNSVIDDTRLLDSQYALWTFIDTSIGWIGQAVGSITQTLASLFVESATDATIPASAAFQVFTFGTVIKDNAGTWSGTTYTIPNDGDYQFLSSMIWDNQSGVTNDLMNLQIRLDGIVVEEIIIDASANFGNDDPAEQTMHVILPNLTAGQVLDFGVANTQDIIDLNADSSVYIAQLPTTLSIPAGSLVVDPIQSQIGYSDVGDILTATGSRTFVGDFSSVTSTLNAGNSQIFSFVFATPFANANYNLQISVEELTKLSTDLSINDFTVPVITQKTATGFDLVFEETSPTAQDLRIHVLAFDKFPNATAMRAEDVAVTEWTAYIPTLLGSTTNPTKATTHVEKAFYRVIGKELQIIWKYSHAAAAGATVGAGDYGVTLPAGFTVDTTVAEVIDPNGIMSSVVGSCMAHVSGLLRSVGSCELEDFGGTTVITMNVVSTVTNNNTIPVGDSLFAINGANTGYSLEARIPIL